MEIAVKTLKVSKSPLAMYINRQAVYMNIRQHEKIDIQHVR